HHRLQEEVEEGVELIEAAGLVERLREVKDEEELRAIAAASELADGVYEELRQRGMLGRTELEVARELEQQFRERGAEPSLPAMESGSGTDSATGWGSRCTRARGWRRPRRGS